VQLGLYVPEFIERDDEAKKSPWYPLFEKYVSATKTLLITLSPDAHLIFFPRSPKPVVSKSPPPKR
jgi:hypothetical protein